MASRNPPQSGGRTCVIVGLDFGTTFSGISYVVLPQRLNRPIFFEWQVDRGCRQERIPTQIEVSGTPIEWFKLSLLHPDDLEKDILDSEKSTKSNSARERMNLTVVDVAAAYLRKIWKVFRDELRYEVTDPLIQITFTVPVLWPDYARKSIYEAIHQANIINNNVELAPEFVAEPEAAALAIFSAAYYLDGEPFSKVRPGQVVIVCDCGGGTTDTVAYEILSVHPFRVREVSPGQSILADHCILDDGFMKLLKEKIAQVISPRVFQTLKEEDYANLVYLHWDTYIKKFFGDDFPTQRIQLPFRWAGRRQRRMPARQGDEVTFTHDEIASIFNPVVEKITTLIETEMRNVPTLLSKDVSYLIMTGGFSQNRYLRDRISQTVNRVSPNTNTLDYPSRLCWNAVSQGAVLHALQALAITATGPGTLQNLQKNDSINAHCPNLRSVPAEAFSVEDHANRDISSIRVCNRQVQNEESRTREVCTLNWKTLDVEFNYGMKPVLKANLQIDFKWDRVVMDFSLFYGSIKQSSVEFK
ncbi:hypothetical protein FCIRC_1021 [Fusarium circinatum]|uniref:Actin-like ATPase domain-containing protein n=1 Tax=Fusarium circinatum TaxID=48490 RepID=A0A8H5XC46_FUSCI|nr:hypothetical protein FCIRC_1021 [Fusarium circinatum]